MTFFTDEMLAEKKENKILNTEKQIRELKKQVKTLQAKIDEFESTTQSTIGQYSINQDMTEITIKMPIDLERVNTHRSRKSIVLTSTRGRDSFRFAGLYSHIDGHEITFNANVNVWIEKPELVASLIGNSRNGNED